ncbi:hypothetical protein EJV47_12095 [Hymenobacter gummosus]|uniref:Outer membrane protein beta-barrel domain-containing protein n=1 Tax=Hymenobacter gummosus TaxID=1776032 RepID=A0A3S0JDX0_9BACT|nr:hypothetical protein [Hymenobacter gummosus]RTQ49559.1 hypothetical protein EJV47_12095 [Hymenobacter gummosus]
MKTLGLSALLSLSTLAAVPATAQTRPVAKPAAKPAATTSKTTTTAKPAAKPATTAAKPVAKPVAAPAEAEETAAAPAKPAAKPAATKAKPSAKSAGNEFGVGSIAANLGIGFGVGYGYYGTLNATPAMSLSVERGSIEGVGPGIIGIGGLVGYKGYSYKYGNGYKSTWNNILVSVRGTYHYNILENPKLDTYAGLSLGVRMQNWKDTYYDNTPGLSGYKSSSAYLTSGIFIGARYMLTDNFGGFGEVGYDMSYLKIGLTARF